MSNEPTTETERRFSIVVGEPVQKQIFVVAKQYKISQSEVIQVLVENADLESLADKFKAKREHKVNARDSKSALMGKIGKLSKEQLEKLLASLPQQ